METEQKPSKSDKKALKDAKKAEKLAKLQKKQEIMQSTPKEVKEKKPTKISSGGYDPSIVEEFWTKCWKDSEWFKPRETESGKKFSICIPPPNITGSLHIGHAMMISIEDAIVRFKRITGHEVLYLPGLDHAGIATQNVVLKSVGNVNREEFMEAAHKWSDKYGSRIYEQFDRMGCSVDYSRKVFTLDSQVSKSVSSAFVNLYNKGLIYRDNKIVNWSGKLKTTLSDLEVNYKETKGGSYIDVDGGSYKFGMLYAFKYYITRNREGEKQPYVVVCTTRPETILGDTAICINPCDPRFSDIDEIFRTGEIPDVMNKNYRENKDSTNLCTSQSKSHESSVNENKNSDCPDHNELNSCLTDKNFTEGEKINEELKTEKKNKYKVDKKIDDSKNYACEGLFAINPLTNHKIPVIFDQTADLSFGTGILKVTPSHDPIDFQLAKKHNLPFLRIIDDENKIIDNGKYNGMKRFEARKAIIQELKDKDLFVNATEHDQILPFCSRSGDIVEPTLKEQWWLNCKGMAQKAINGVETGEIKMYPEEAKNIWNRWLENIRDWCLSRQLWWGHRIPAYKIVGSDEWIVAESENDALKIAKDRGFSQIKQDEDVLDTWFSSGLWPFSTMGWPNKTEDFNRYFPNSMLETGSDILFFWVARMVMLSYELCGTHPFHTILLHGIVRDSHGRKMSKSLGNVIDPLYVIEGISIENMIQNLHLGNLDKREITRASDAIKKDYPQGIPKCGADALRFALLNYTNGMKDVNLDVLRVQGYSRLCNKLYNAYKFITMMLENTTELSELNHECSYRSNLSNNIPLEKLSIKSSDHCCMNFDNGKIIYALFEKIQKSNSLMDHQKWILQRLNETIQEQHNSLESYNFMTATQSINGFFYDFCDYFIEVSKNKSPMDLEILCYVFSSILRIIYPFMPFVSEELHHRLFKGMINSYPSHCESDLTSNFDLIIKLTKLCRSKDVTVENFDGVEYLKILTKNSVKIIDKLDTFEILGDFKYSINE